MRAIWTLPPQHSQPDRYEAVTATSGGVRISDEPHHRRNLKRTANSSPMQGLTLSQRQWLSRAQQNCRPVGSEKAPKQSSSSCPAKNALPISDRQQLMCQFTHTATAHSPRMAIRTIQLPASRYPITRVRRRMLRHKAIKVGAAMIKKGLKRYSPPVRGTDGARNSVITLSTHQKQMASLDKTTPFMLLARIQVKSGCIDQYLEIARVTDSADQASEPCMLHHTLDEEPDDP